MGKITPEQLKPRFSDVADQVRDPKGVMQDIVLIGEGEAKKQISSGPNKAIRTGHLRRDIHGKVETAQRGKVGTSVKYGRYVHEGTKYMKARPFIKEGIDHSIPRIGGVLEKWGKQLLDQVGK